MITRMNLKGTSLKPIEETVANVALGFAIGVMTVIAGDKLLEKNAPIPDGENDPGRGAHQYVSTRRQRCTEHEPGEL